MIVKFELIEVSCGSWNGVDTRKKREKLIFVDLPKEKANELDGKKFHHDFRDGWSVKVLCSKARKGKYTGFGNYDWMVEEIIKYGQTFERDHSRFKNKFKNAYEEFVNNFVAENVCLDTNTEYQTSFCKDLLSIALNNKKKKDLEIARKKIEGKPEE